MSTVALYYISFLTVIPAVYGYIIYEDLDESIRFLLKYFVVAIVYTAAALLATIYVHNNLWLINLFLPIQTGMVMWFYSLTQKEGFVQRLMRTSIKVFAGIWLAENTIRWILVDSSVIGDFTIVSRPLSALMYVAAAGFTLYQSGFKIETPLFSQPLFWVNCSFLMYFSAMLPMYLWSHPLIHFSIDQFKVMFYYISPAFNILANLLFIGGIYCQSRLTKFPLHLQNTSG